MVLDCGAGLRTDFYENVIACEIVDYPSTDVLAVNQSLPFPDETFDVVLSLNVLEHVSDPFLCASELARVVKRHGKVYCVVPFLQPEHGYPNHFFNMTRRGAVQLFDKKLAIDKHFVPRSGHPVWTTHWFLSWYWQQLSPEVRERFA